MQKLEAALGSDRMSLLKILGVDDDIAATPSVTMDGFSACFGPITVSESSEAMNVCDVVETKVRLTLDSGCVDHIADLADVPGYRCVLEPSAGSKRWQNFVVGNGAGVPNEGQVRLRMKTAEGKLMASVFQVAEITRPLMSVSKICDQDIFCLFSKKEARVITESGDVLAVFQRDGGLYTAEMTLCAPIQNYEDKLGVKAKPSHFSRPAR